MRFLNLAHRGASGVAPENTNAAYEAAIEAGATGIETDLRLTADGHVVVIHDRTVDRTTDGTGAVSDLRLEELADLDAGSWFDASFAGERVPTLEAAFEWVQGRTSLVLDVKQDAGGMIEEKIVELARAHSMVDAVTVSSRLSSVLARVKKLEPRIETGLLSYFFDWRWWMSHMLNRIRRLDAGTISPRASTVTPAMLEFFHRQGVVVRAWGVGSDEDLAASLIRLGVDGMTYNLPRQLWKIWEQENSQSND